MPVPLVSTVISERESHLFLQQLHIKSVETMRQLSLREAVRSLRRDDDVPTLRSNGPNIRRLQGTPGLVRNLGLALQVSVTFVLHKP